MKALLPVAEKIAASLIARKQTIAIAESSTGGLVAATLLAVPGASAYFLGGAVVYTKSARVALLGIGESEMKGLCACAMVPPGASASFSQIVRWSFCAPMRRKRPTPLRRSWSIGAT